MDIIGIIIMSIFLSKPCEGCRPQEILEDAIPVFYQRKMFAGKNLMLSLISKFHMC